MHLVRTALIASLCCLPLLHAVGCGDNTGGQQDADAFATLEECFTEHHTTEAFDVNKAIVICCLSHPIGGNAAGVVCGADAAACTTYVTANLVASDATSAEISTACTEYITQKGM